MSGRPPPIPKPIDGDRNIAYRLEVGTTVTFLLAAITVGLRVLGRTMYARLGSDDYFMLMAIVCALCATIIQWVATTYGLGRHAYYLDPHQQARQQYFSYIGQAFCVFSLTFAKISISLSNLRVIRGAQRLGLKVLRWVCWFVIVSVVIVNVIVVIMFWAACIPAEKSWNRAIPGTCLSPLVSISFVLLQGSYSALTDFILCVIPIFYIKDLQVSRKSKITLCILMGVGLITGIFAIVRTVESGAGVHGPGYDISFISIDGLMWAGMERNFAIILGSIPALRSLAAPAKSFTSRYYSRLMSKNTTSGHSHMYEMKDSKDVDDRAGSQASSRQYLKRDLPPLPYHSTTSQDSDRMLPVQYPGSMNRI